MASSHHNGDDSFHNNYFESNNYFSNLDPSLVNPHDDLSEQAWSIQPNQLNIARGFQPSERQQWQNTPPPLSNAAPATSYMDQNGQFGRAYSSAATQFQNVHVSQNLYNTYQQSPYDPSIISPSTTSASRYGFPNAAVPVAGRQNRTIAPEALQTLPVHSRTSVTPQPQQSTDSVIVASNLPLPKIPPGIAHGKFLIVDPALLNEITASRRMHNFVDIGDQAYDVVITKSTIPVYTPRKSRNEIKQLLATDSRLSAKLSKRLPKHGHISAPKGVMRTNSSDSATAKRLVSLSEDSSSEEESSDDSDYESSEDEADKSPLPTVRPTGAIESVKYDCIKALWRPRNRPASSDDIRDGLKHFWELFQTIRDRWKSDSADVKQAEDSKKNHEIPLLKERVAKQREMAEFSLRAAMDYGHPDIIEHFGEYLPFMGSLAAFLTERARESEYSGSFALTVLEFISRCKTLTDGALEKTSIAKVLPRYAKRGDKAAQTFAKRITDNAAAASRKRKETAKSPVPVIQAKDVKEPLAVKAGVKRRVGDAPNEQPLKKLAGVTVSTTTKPNLKKATADVKPPVVAAKQVIAKPTSFFSGLQSAAKKPGTSNAAVAAAQSKPALDNTVEKKSPVASAGTIQTKALAAPAFSFAATMANLTKPKEAEPVVKSDESGPPETDVEKAKRLRKEERRKLRVSWRPEESLVAVKYFTHDPEEELGHDASQVRDVGDIGSEGRMLKEHRDQMDIDDEDEDTSKPTDKLWRDPTLIDFSDIGPEEQARNYVPYGGGTQKPESPERQVQEQREANTLMVFYSSPADIPSTPKEAPAENAVETTVVKDFGPPPAQVLERLATIVAQQQKPMVPVATPNPLAAYDLTAILGLLGNTPATPAPTAPPVPAQQLQSASDLESIFAKFATPIAPQQQQQHHQIPPAFSFGGIAPQTPQPYAQVPAALPSTSALSDLLASLVPQAAQVQAVPPMQQQMPLGMPLMPQIPGGVPDYGQQYAQQYAWMQQMYAQQHQQAAQAAQLQQQQQQSYPYENEERRRYRESSGNMGGHDGSDETNDVNGFNKRQMKQPLLQGPPPKKRPGHPPMFVVQCKYFNEGKCKKGADCTFRHDIL